jgi:hypothetical protein
VASTRGGYFRAEYLTLFARVGPRNDGWEVSANGLLSFAICER